jgi:hypothetical protein
MMKPLTGVISILSPFFILLDKVEAETFKAIDTSFNEPDTNCLVAGS